MSNIRPYVIINGVDSRTITGLLITSLPPISKPAQRTLTETIDGRDGDSSVKLGYSAYDKSLGIALTFGYNVDDVISFFNSEGTIVFSNEPDKLYNFEIFEAIDFEKLIRFKTATVTIHTQPFKFSTTENPLEFTSKEFTVVNNGNTDSRPNLVITGEGLATMQINGKNALNIDFGDAEQTLLIDSEGMNAYYTNNIKSIEAEIVPKQDLHGFDSPFIDSDKVNKVPYLSRALAGTAERIGNYEYNKLVGGTVAFNQLIALSSNVENGLRAELDSDGVISISGISTSSCANISLRVPSLADNHKYYIAKTVINNPNNIVIGWGFLNTQTNPPYSTLATSGTSANIININSHTGDFTGIIGFSANTDFTGVKIKLICIDLTQMLGATIADYIYGFEQAQAGAGVAYFKALGFNKDYYPYNAGELMSVKTSAHVTKNAGGAVIQTVALDPNLELSGIPKLDANNKLYYDGDTYSADGSVSRHFTKLIFNGSENWQIYETAGINQLYVLLDNIKSSAQGITTVCAKYKPISINDRANNYNTCYTGAGSVSFNVEGYTVESWKSFLSSNNVEIICELATPTSESAEPFNNPVAIDANGSEEFTDSRAVAIPIGHESYYANICDIEGFTEVNLVRAGVNLNSGLEQITIEASQTSISPTITRELLKAGSTYTISCYQESAMSSNTRNTLSLNKVGDPSITYYESTQPNYHLAKGLHTLTVTIQSTGLYDVVFCGHTLASTTVYSNFQIELGSEATDFSAYAGEIFKAEFEQEGEPVAVYGGKYNFTTGLLELTHAKKQVLSTMHFTTGGGWTDTAYSIDNFFTDGLNIAGYGTVDDLTCNVGLADTPSRLASGQGRGVGHGAGYALFFNIGLDLDTVKALCDSSEGFYITYPLAEHIFIELDEQVISALLGINNFYADTGNVTVIFVNDGQDETQTGAIVSFDLDESDLNKGDLANRLVSGNYANIRLKTGSNAIKFIGSVSAVGLDKYSRWL